MHWLVDHAGTVYLLLGVVALGFVAAFWVNRRVKALGLAAGVLAVIGLFWLLTQYVVTDRRQVERNVRAMADGLIEGNADKVMRHVAGSFQYRGRDRKWIDDRVRFVIRSYKVTDIRLWNIQVPEASRDAKTAKIEFNARASGSPGEAFYYFRCDFVLEGDDWRLQSFEVYNPVNEQKVDLPL